MPRIMILTFQGYSSTSCLIAINIVSYSTQGCVYLFFQQYDINTQPVSHVFFHLITKEGELSLEYIVGTC